MASSTTAEDHERLTRRFPEEVATDGNIDRIDTICAEGVVEPPTE